MNLYDGKITTTKPLDYEAKSSFVLQIIVMVSLLYLYGCLKDVLVKNVFCIYVLKSSFVHCEYLSFVHYEYQKRDLLYVMDASKTSFKLLVFTR